ncbi:MAG: lamin tail domain-containing protein, partial [Verrucomicrobia bacterium]|nr:lamin tail domain-containing protein [Verrucomicrobiota bacterium]
MLHDVNPTDLAPQPPVLSRKRAPNGTAALLTALSLLILLPFVKGAHRVLITEVMSANQRTVVDEDRQASDWIELLNAGSQPVQLAGWKLTADPKQAKTWTFPELAVKPGEHILVFASGKNRAVAGKELHTDFKLDADGEYLALLGPDGKTVVQEFKPRLPAMRSDVSYGIPLSMETSRILDADSPKQIRVPWAEMGEAWRQPTIPMEGWFSAKGGIGFDSGTNFARFLGTDSAAMMKGRSPGLLVRAPFLVKPAEVDRMVLRMFYDDGFVAWINGREVARRNAPAQLVWNSPAPGPRESATAVTWKESFESAEPDFVLANGDASARARVAVAAPDTNRFLRLVNGRVPEQINSVSFPQALPAAPKSLKVEFDYRVKGGSGSPTDLYLVLIPVKDFDVRGPGADVQVFRGGADLELRKGLAVRLSTQPSRKQVEATIHWDGAQMGRFTSDESSLIWRFYHRAFLTVDFTEEGAVVALNVKTDSRGGTGKEAVVLQRTLIQGAQPYPARLQIAARTTSSLTTVDLDEMQASWVPAAGSLAEDFDLTPFVSDLKPGTNLLSIFALNRSSDDGDFLVLPELYGYAARLQTSSPRFFAPASPLSANQEGGLEAPYPA